VSGPRDRSMAALLVAVLCSSTSTVTLDTALGLEVFSISHRPLDLGLLGLAAFAPAFLLVVVTGLIADRFARSRVAVVALLGQAVVTVAIGAYVATTPTA